MKISIAEICEDLIKGKKVIDYLSLTDGIIGQIVNMVCCAIVAISYAK